MLVYELTYLFVEDYQEVAIYDLNSEKVVYKGTIDEMDYKYKQLEIASIDCIENNILTINVEQ